MNLNENIKKILILNNLNPEKVPTSEQWNKVLDQFDVVCAEYEQNHLQMKKMLDLGYEEIQKVWDLIQQRESLLKAIFDCSQDAILTLDSKGQVIEFNHVMRQLINLPVEKISGQAVFMIIPSGTLVEDLKMCFWDPLHTFIDSFLGKIHERTIVNESGKEIIVSVYFNKVKTGETFIYPLYIKDITAAKETERVLQESRAQLMHTSKLSSLGEMAGGVAHEINTPLAVIQMRATQLIECLSEEPFDREMARNALHAIDNTVKRISKIVSGLRSFARDGRADQMVLSSVVKIVEDTFSLCREKFNNHGVQLEFNRAQDVEIECRPGEISQVILNFLNNSYDAIEGLPDLWVRVELVVENEIIKLMITDCGNGIPVEIQKKMMQPFFTTKEVGKGTGLGLSISKGIVESHNGKIEIDSDCPNTKFIITLPRRQTNSGAV